MQIPNLLRRRLTLSSVTAPLLIVTEGCTPPLRTLTHASSAADARALLDASAAAHGADALSGISDVSVRYVGHWRAVVDRLQPALVDSGYRGVSEERLLLANGSVAQAFTGPSGHKQVVRRVRFTLNGLESTQGAIAQVDMEDHLARDGVLWPTRYYERLLRPLPLPVHNWTLAGFDVNRGLTPADIDGSAFSARAARPATPLRSP